MLEFCRDYMPEAIQFDYVKPLDCRVAEPVLSEAKVLLAMTVVVAYWRIYTIWKENSKTYKGLVKP